jgi:hypothetical protein
MAERWLDREAATEEVGALMYLPSHCSLRETDIWRGLLAQRVLWTFGAGVMFHQATVHQVRNAHDLRQDFREEMRLYTRVAQVAERLGALNLDRSKPAMGTNLLRCYEEMVRLEIFPKEELSLLECWLDDLAAVRP